MVDTGSHPSLWNLLYIVHLFLGSDTMDPFPIIPSLTLAQSSSFKLIFFDTLFINDIRMLDYTMILPTFPSQRRSTLKQPSPQYPLSLPLISQLGLQTCQRECLETCLANQCLSWSLSLLCLRSLHGEEILPCWVPSSRNSDD